MMCWVGVGRRRIVFVYLSGGTPFDFFVLKVVLAT